MVGGSEACTLASALHPGRVRPGSISASTCFNELTERRLRRGVFSWASHLIEAIEIWAEHWNDDPKPLRMAQACRGDHRQGPTRPGDSYTYPSQIRDVPLGAGRTGDEGARTVPGAASRPFASLPWRLARGGLPRRTVRMRLALAYGALFLLCAAALLAISYFFVARFPYSATVRVSSPNGNPIVSSGPGTTSAAGPSTSHVVHNLPVGSDEVRRLH